MAEPMPNRRAVLLRGHLLDSLILSKALDEILDRGGDYTIDRIQVGHRRAEPTETQLDVGAPTPEQLDAILGRLRELGAVELTESNSA